MAKETRALDPKPWTLHDLWAKYEDIAMHFNDLLIRLRTQALAAVAALSTLVGIFTKTDPNSIHTSWEVATAVFIGLAVFWTAIWLLDRLYYNRLLLGAIDSLKKIELQSKGIQGAIEVDLSTTIENRVGSPRGITFFYILVLGAIVLGAGYCFLKERATWSQPNPPCPVCVPSGPG